MTPQEKLRKAARLCGELQKRLDVAIETLHILTDAEYHAEWCESLMGGEEEDCSCSCEIARTALRILHDI